jgi:quercetin dioxygenase-like cupin family protein
MKDAMLKNRWVHTICFVLSAILLAQTYPPPYPRENTKKVLANDRVIVWDVTWPKGQPTAMHEHRLDQLSVTLRGGTVRVSKLGGPVAVNQSTVGSVAFTPHGTVHMEEGLSDVPQHKIMLELQPSTAPPTNAVPREGAVKLLENDRVIVWDFTWKPGQRVAHPADPFDSVTVFLEGGVLRSGTEEIQRSAGQVIYSSRRAEPHSEEAAEGTPRAVIVELK